MSTILVNGLNEQLNNNANSGNSLKWDFQITKNGTNAFYQTWMNYLYEVASSEIGFAFKTLTEGTWLSSE